MIPLDNGKIRVAIDEKSGADLRFLGPSEGPNALALYDDWSVPLRASRSSSYGDGIADWLSEYRGGWQELCPNAGPPCVVNGVPLPFHGEVSMAEWDVVARDELSATLRVGSRLPLELERRVKLDPEGAVLRIESSLHNISSQPVPYLWGHHPAFATPAGTRLDLPARAVEVGELSEPHHDLMPGSSGQWPDAAARHGGMARLDEVPDASVERLCYLPDLASGWGALRDTSAGRGVAIAWDVETFPHAWLWQNLGGPGFPFYGRAQLTAIEPHSAWPAAGLAEHVERGTASVLDPGATQETWLTAVLFEATERSVVGVDRAGVVELE